MRRSHGSSSDTKIPAAADTLQFNNPWLAAERDQSTDMQTDFIEISTVPETPTTVGKDKDSQTPSVSDSVQSSPMVDPSSGAGNHAL